MKHFNEVAVPSLITQNCEQDKRGLYVPFVVLKEDNVYHFKINDNVKVEECVKDKLCSICGTELKDDSWFIGGPASVFHIYGAIADLPVHKECGQYALQACPYMAYDRYTSKTDLNNLYKQLKNKNIGLINPSLDNDRVPIFCFVKATDYSVRITNTFLFTPVRPYLEIEFWWNGEKLGLKEGEEILIKHFEDKYSLNYLDYEFKEKQKDSM